MNWSGIMSYKGDGIFPKAVVGQRFRELLTLWYYLPRKADEIFEGSACGLWSMKGTASDLG